MLVGNQPQRFPGWRPIGSRLTADSIVRSVRRCSHKRSAARGNEDEFERDIMTSRLQRLARDHSAPSISGRASFDQCIIQRLLPTRRVEPGEGVPGRQAVHGLLLIYHIRSSSEASAASAV